MEITTRVRIRFRKEGDLRWISHRDVARTWQRVFRRAKLRLKRTQGFHPKDKISFPLALSLGIVGTEELMEIEVLADVTEDQVQTALEDHLPHGLGIERIQIVESQARKTRVECIVYEVPVDADRCAALAAEIEAFREHQTYWIQRPGRDKPLDMCADLADLQLRDGVLLIRQRVSETATANPREILTALGVTDEEQSRYTITRSQVKAVT